MISFRYWFRLISTIFVRFKTGIVFGIIIGLLMFAFARVLLPVVTSSVEYIGITGRYHTEELPAAILSQVGEGLTNIEADGSVISGLAESWEALEDGRVWKFNLKKGLHWQDGSEVNSSTIQYSFDDAKVAKPDDYTIVFELASAFSPFPSVVSRPTFKRGLLGTGEWEVVDVSLSSGYVESISLRNSLSEKKIYKFYPTEERAKTAFKLGDVDKIEVVDPSPFDEWDTAEVKEEVNLKRFVGVFFNNDNDMFRDNKPLRQALSYAIDKQVFGAPRALGPLSPDSWAFNSQVKEYKFDIERSREILEEMPEELRKDLNITLSTSSNLLKVAEKIAEYWRSAGVNTNVSVVSILPEDYQAFLAIYDIPDDPDQYSTWHSTQEQSNITSYQNPRVDKLLEDGRLQLDHEARKKIYLDFQRFLLEDAPVVFLYHPMKYTVVRK
ncbi:ABC transporter substrate-binding protein [Candidatus Microgenomates bacterium]|nr:MAG: ABC transporter substrate-binding protein [Candidatus Microgenomates bacterium]